MATPTEPDRIARMVFPWPSRNLSPNARLHWAQKHKAVKAARLAAWALAREAVAGVDRSQWGAGRIALRVTLFPPDARRRDFDNAIASLKATLDGLADAMVVDDSRFRPVFAFGEPVKGGKVAVDVPYFALGGAVEREEGVGGCRSALPDWLRS